MMNAPYLILGLLCGLAIGYAFGWQYGQRLRKARDPISRMAGWSDARYISELEDMVRAMRRDREKLAQVRRTVADCAGGSPCTDCTEKRRCAAIGCVRMAEACDPPMGRPTQDFAAAPTHEYLAIQRIRAGIAGDRCDGDTEYARGVNAACENHLRLIDGVQGGNDGR